MEDEILKRLCDAEIPDLMTVLETKFPDSISVYNWIRVHQVWKDEIPEIKVDILCPRGDWRSGSVVIMCRELMLGDRFYMSMYCDDDKIEELIEGLRETSLIQWSNLGRISEVKKPLYNPLKTLLATKIKAEPREILCHFLFLSKEKAAQVAVSNPTDAQVRVSRIDIKYLDSVCQMYDHFCESFKPLIRATLNHNHTIGVFVDDQLVTMAAEVERGGLGMVVTHPDHKKKGYATVAMTHLVRAMGQAGINVQSTVMLENVTSIRLHQRAGFDKMCGEGFFFDYMHMDHPKNISENDIYL